MSFFVTALGDRDMAENEGGNEKGQSADGVRDFRVEKPVGG